MVELCLPFKKFRKNLSSFVEKKNILESRSENVLEKRNILEVRLDLFFHIYFIKKWGSKFWIRKNPSIFRVFFRKASTQFCLDQKCHLYPFWYPYSSTQVFGYLGSNFLIKIFAQLFLTFATALFQNIFVQKVRFGGVIKFFTWANIIRPS